jgi:hypothetical protein
VSTTANTLLALPETPGSEVWSTKIRKRARTLVKSINQGYMELAEIIHTVWCTTINGEPHNACVTVAWGYESYKQWASEELGLHPRKVERLKAIWHHLHVTLEGKLDRRIRNKIIDLGWTKVRELIRVIDADNAEQWVEVAENLNYNELCEVIRRALEDQEKKDQAAAVGVADDDDEEEFHGHDPPPDMDRFKQMSFMLSPEQKANVELALERAGQLANSVKPGHLLDLICTDFLSTNDFRRKDDPLRHLTFLAKFERLMGKRLVVIDATTWVIEYGMDALSKVADNLEANSE